MINGNLNKILITSGIATLTGILSFMGGGIVSNDVRNTAQHTAIRKEMVSADLATLDKIDKVKDIVTDIRLEQAEQRGLLNDIKGKLK